jgi:hypothetical protein
MKTPTLALLFLACTTSMASAQEMRPGVPSVLYFVSIPIDGITRKDNEPVMGFALQGSRPFQAVRFDSRMMNFLGTGLEAKWLLAGAVAAGGAVAVSRKDKSVTQQQRQQAQQQAQQPPAQPCPKVPAC